MFEKEKDLDIYNYFNPNIRENLFPTFEITETEYWKVELGTAAAYWNSVGGLTSYDDINVMF